MLLDKSAIQHLQTMRGSITKLRPHNGGGYRIAKYVLKDESKPDTYANRSWYEAAVERELDDVSAVAKKYFGEGFLRPTLGGDRTPEFPGFSVHRAE